MGNAVSVWLGLEWWRGGGEGSPCLMSVLEFQPLPVTYRQLHLSNQLGQTSLNPNDHKGINEHLNVVSYFHRTD